MVTWYTPGKLACSQAIADLPTYGSRLFALGKAYAFSDFVRHITLTRHACVHSFFVLYWFQYFVFPLTEAPHNYEFSRSGVRRWCTSRGQNRSARVATKWRGPTHGPNGIAILFLQNTSRQTKISRSYNIFADVCDYMPILFKSTSGFIYPVNLRRRQLKKKFYS